MAAIKYTWNVLEKYGFYNLLKGFDHDLKASLTEENSFLPSR